MDYRIIYAVAIKYEDCISSLEWQVNNFLKNNYKVVGGINTIVSVGGIYISQQAMIRKG